MDEDFVFTTSWDLLLRSGSYNSLLKKLTSSELEIWHDAKPHICSIKNKKRDVSVNMFRSKSVDREADFPGGRGFKLQQEKNGAVRFPRAEGWQQHFSDCLFKINHHLMAK